MRDSKGFTLLELMIVVLFIALLAAVAIPSYQAYTRDSYAKFAIQEMDKIAIDLQRHKARNFSYRGYFITDSQTGTFTNLKRNGKSLYEVTLYDLNTSSGLNASNAIGQNWAMRAKSADPKNIGILITSTGIRCKNAAQENISLTSCGVGGDDL